MANILYKNNAVLITQVDSYNALKQATKPLINSVVLEGNKTSGELNMYTKEEVNQLISLSRQVYQTNAIPTNPQRNTMYYVGTSTPYDIYLYDSDLNRISLGTTNFDFSDYQKKVDNSLATTSKNVVGAINELKASDDLKQPIIDDTLTTTNKTVPTAINELDAVVKVLPDTYAPLQSAYFTLNNFVAADNAVFVPKDFNGTSGVRIVERKVYTSTMTDPITSSPIYGWIETTIYCDSLSIYVDQIFEQNQYAVRGSFVRFKRRGNAQLAAGSTTFEPSDITWKDWIVWDYPPTEITGYGSITYSFWSVRNGIVALRVRYQASSTNTYSIPIPNLGYQSASFGTPTFTVWDDSGTKHCRVEIKETSSGPILEFNTVSGTGAFRTALAWAIGY